MRLFEVPATAVANDSAGISVRADDGWPSVETSFCGRFGFWRERTPRVFGFRESVGPLIICPDTNVLISLRQQIAEVEGGEGLVVRPRWGGQGKDAFRDLIQLWWWRDVRFWVGEEHLNDARRAMSPERAAIRGAAVEQLGQDFVERGGHETAVWDDSSLTSCSCHEHSVPPSRESETRILVRWPTGRLDRSLVRAALRNACHVFLTHDKGVLKRRDWFARYGLAIMTPAELIGALMETGDLDDHVDFAFPVPDISALARLYGAFAHDE